MNFIYFIEVLYKNMESFTKTLKPHSDSLKNYISTLRNYYIENYFLHNLQSTKSKSKSVKSKSVKSKSIKSQSIHSQSNKSIDFKDSVKTFDTFIKNYNYVDLKKFKTCKDFNDLYSTVCNYGRIKTCRAFNLAMFTTNAIYESAFEQNEYKHYDNIHKHLTKIIDAPGHCNISMGGKSRKRRTNKKIRNTRHRKKYNKTHNLFLW